MIVLAGDIGGTNSRLALFRDGASVFERSYASARYDSLETVVALFFDESDRALTPIPRPERGCVAVAGPVEGGTARITNLSWLVDARALEARLHIAPLILVNDFHAAAMGVTALVAEDLVPLGGGPRDPTGPVAVAGAGTGLGEAFLVWSASQGCYQVVPSEGGHADFAPRTPLERELAMFLEARYGRVSYERVVSGPGLKDVFLFLTSDPERRALVTEETMRGMASEDETAVIVRQAAAGADPVCAMAVGLFSAVFGALAGNLALTVLATGGVFLAGGIAPRITGLLAGGGFREAFEAKGRLQPFVAKVPAYVVTHPAVGLLGAAALARRGL